MPIPKILLAQFCENNFFHVFCKSIDERKLFTNNDNRALFLQRFNYFLTPFVNTYGYSLLPNHAHFLIKPNSTKSIINFLNECDPDLLTHTHRKFIESDQITTYHELIEQKFNRFFISYALKYNIQQKQKGHLFLRPFKRKPVNDDLHLTQLMIYIHANPVKHKIIKDLTYYKWSSYQALLSDSPTHLCREEVLNWFGGKENFIRVHHEQTLHYYNHPDAME